MGVGFHSVSPNLREKLLSVSQIAYSLATFQGQELKHNGLDVYAGRINEHQDKTPRQSAFSIGLYGQRWRYGMELWAERAFKLIALKPHKHRYFQRGLQALSFIQ